MEVWFTLCILVNDNKNLNRFQTFHSKILNVSKCDQWEKVKEVHVKSLYFMGQ